MKCSLKVYMFLLVVVTARPLVAQSDRASLLMQLQRSAQRETSGIAISDIALQGTATRSLENGPETATVLLRADAGGSSLLILSGSKADLNETTASSLSSKRLKVWRSKAARQVASTSPTATVTSSDSTAEVETGITRPTTLFPVVPWCLPYFALKSALLAAGELDIAALPGTPSSQDIGIQMRYHTTDQKVVLTGEMLGIYPDEVVLDHETVLPKSIVFRHPITVEHPKSAYVDAHPAIEERIEYSDYKQVEGVAIPMHIRVLMQKQPYLDIRITSAQLNTGYKISTPSE